jgi:FdrA protein
MPTGCLVERNAYFDSVVLMRISAELNRRPEVSAASLMMGTAANKDLLRAAGLLTGPGENAGADDLVIAVAADGVNLDELLEAARSLLATGSPPAQDGEGSRPRVRTIAEANADRDANLALISTPGEYAAAEALKALRLGLHVFLFSDNVSIEHEVMLKREAADRGLLLMGPDCGTAVINGVPLGFANEVRRGSVGLIGASGTGLQQISTLLDRGGAGVSQIIGVGGRDLSEDVGAASMLAALDALAADAQTSIIVLVSKPPADDVAERVLARAAGTGKPVVACFLGLEGTVAGAEDMHTAPTLEDAARRVLALHGGGDSDLGAPPAEGEQLALGLAPDRRLLRALYTGGTFAYEADHLLGGALGGIVHGVEGFVAGQPVELPDQHLVLDLGDDQFTVGRPHPMIDPAIRLDFLAAAGASASTAVIVLDVVLGHGAAEDPVGPLLPSIEAIREQGAGPVVIAFVVGTERDPQDSASAERRLQDAGAVVVPSSTTAIRLARDLVAAQTSERALS